MGAERGGVNIFIEETTDKEGAGNIPAVREEVKIKENTALIIGWRVNMNVRDVVFVKNKASYVTLYRLKGRDMFGQVGTPNDRGIL